MAMEGILGVAEEGRQWDDFDEPYPNKDVFTSVFTRIQSMAGILMEEGNERLQCVGRVVPVKVEEVTLQAKSDSPKETWQLAINEAREDATVVFTDGSKGEDGRVGAGWYQEVREVKGMLGLGKAATVWDGEVAGMKKALEKVGRDRKILILSDSQVAIVAVKKAGETAKARTKDLQKIIQQIGRRQDNLGPDAVRFGWVKSHIGIAGKEKADEQAKVGTEDLYPNPPYITEGGLKQELKKRREAERRVKGTGMGRVLRWNRQASVNYVHCRTGKGNLQV